MKFEYYNIKLSEIQVQESPVQTFSQTPTTPG